MDKNQDGRIDIEELKQNLFPLASKENLKHLLQVFRYTVHHYYFLHLQLFYLALSSYTVGLFPILTILSSIYPKKSLKIFHHNLGFRLKQRSHGRHEGIHYNMRLERSTLWHEVQFILIYVRLSIVINNENFCCALTELKVVQQHWHSTCKGWPNILQYTRYMQGNS
jgi:hypothetical protein